MGFSEIQEDANLMNPSAFQQRSTSQQSDDAKPQIKQLLTALKAEHSTESEHTQWCMQERARNELQLRLKQDAVDQLDAEITSHADAEAQLDEDLSSIDERVAFLEKSAKDVEAMGKKEKALAENTGKDHQLATRILDQAVAILSDFEARGAAEGFPAAISKGAGNAASALRSARATFAALNSAAASYIQEVDKDPYGVDGNANDGSAVAQKELSPMERAAMEM